MTPEEIAKQQQFSPESYLADLIREAVRDAVIQAYEKAAKVAESYPDYKIGWSKNIAAAIRELKP